MMKAQALHSFWSRYLKSYDENTVPDNASFPYITYMSASDSFDETLSLSASLYYKSTSWFDIENKTQEISHDIGMGGLLVPYAGGTLWIKRGTPFSQRSSDVTDDTIRRIIINIEVEYISAN